MHSTLKGIVSISKDAVIDYVGYAQQSYLIFAIRNYYSKLVDNETTPKYYFSDNGLLNLFLDKAEARLLENPVAVNLWNSYKDKIYYLKSRNVDLDFFVEKNRWSYTSGFSRFRRFLIIEKQRLLFRRLPPSKKQKNLYHHV